MSQAPYSDKVMDHFSNPRNVGEISDASGVGIVGNPVCGDVMKMFLKIENDIIVDAKFKTFGCGAAVATSSMVTEMVKGKSIDEALKISNKAVAEALGGLPPVKMHCSVLAEEALRSALKDYFVKQGKPVPFDDKGHEHHGEKCL
jgi:nitrogen fixation NifU-like protein